MATRVYRVWPADEHEHDNIRRTYTEHESRSAAIKHAEYYDQNHGYEGSWPMTFIVRDLGEVFGLVDNHGDLYKFEVERESEPIYRTSYKEPEKLEIGVHDRMTAGPHGEYICSCAHPFRFAGECTRCLCATGKRFFTMDSGGATYSFVARDVDHCKQLLRDVDVVLTKEDGDEANIDDPAFADVEWIEHTQDEASRIKCHPDDGGKPSQPLTTYELGAWFCSEY